MNWVELGGAFRAHHAQLNTKEARALIATAAKRASVSQSVLRADIAEFGWIELPNNQCLRHDGHNCWTLISPEISIDNQEAV